MDPEMEVTQLLNNAGPTTTKEQMVSLLTHPSTEEGHVLAVLRRRDLSVIAIETIARDERWGTRYAVRATIVNHPKTPKTLALRWVALLYWKELSHVSSNFRLAVPLRRAAETLLIARLPQLELGERIALARVATERVASILATERNARVVAALLTNPRLREPVVLSLAEDSKTPPEVLGEVAASERWATCYSVKLAVVKNPRTPVHAALRLLATLPQRTIASLTAGSELPRIVQMGAQRFLGDKRLH